MLDVNAGNIEINGAKGKYDGCGIDSSAKYGRNAVDNFYSYSEKPIVNDNMALPPILDVNLNSTNVDRNINSVESYINKNDEYLNSLPPLEFEYRYMPKISQGNIDKKALLAAAYEELGKKYERDVEDIDNNLLPNSDLSCKALDIDENGKIDIAEYSSSILVADMLSKGDEPKMKNIDGTINKKGFDAILAYNKKSNASAARKLYTDVFNNFGLENAKKDFEPED